MSTRDEHVTVRDLRNLGRSVIDRILAGECLTVTRAGRPVAVLRPVRKPADRSDVLLERWRSLPVAEADDLQRDLDAVIDASV